METQVTLSGKKVVAALKKYRQTMDDWVKPIDNVRRLRSSVANEFLLQVMFDKNIKAEMAEEAAQWFNDSMGDPGNVRTLWENLAEIEPKRLTGFLRYGYGGYAFVRFYKTYARLLPQAAKAILENYDGDPRNIWSNQRDVAIVRERLEELPGIGIALSRMAVLSLVTYYGLLGGKQALPHIDIKPDVQLMRVFRRIGLIKLNDTEKDAITIAKLYNPTFPGELDAPSWEIGREWCRPTSPKCQECPIVEACPRLIKKS